MRSEMVEDVVLEYVRERFGEKSNAHQSYCKFPEETCSCKILENIDYDTSLITGGYIDSFSMVAVLVFIERQFNIKIQDSDATPENMDTVNKIVQLIKKYI